MIIIQEKRVSIAVSAMTSIGQIFIVNNLYRIINYPQWYLRLIMMINMRHVKIYNQLYLIDLLLEALLKAYISIISTSIAIFINSTYIYDITKKTLSILILSVK